MRETEWEGKKHCGIQNTSGMKTMRVDDVPLSHIHRGHQHEGTFRGSNALSQMASIPKRNGNDRAFEHTEFAQMEIPQANDYFMEHYLLFNNY